MWKTSRVIYTLHTDVYAYGLDVFSLKLLAINWVTGLAITVYPKTFDR